MKSRVGRKMYSMLLSKNLIADCRVDCDVNVKDNKHTMDNRGKCGCGTETET